MNALAGRTATGRASARYRYSFPYPPTSTPFYNRPIRPHNRTTARMQQTILAQIAPQRSTQYAELASCLAPHELVLSPLRERIAALVPCRLGSQDYLRFELTGPVTAKERYLFGTLAMTSAYFEYFSRLGEHEGPFLRPIEDGFTPVFPATLTTARRYKGKTNELFTQWLCNIAKFSSAFADNPWNDLTLVDPLAGGGTTLFVGLVLGAETVAGIDHKPKDGKSLALFLQKFAHEKRIAVGMKEERLKKLGQRWTLTLSQKQTRARENAPDAPLAHRQIAIIALGDTAEAQRLLPGLKAHLLVADLPYGIQHQGQILALLERALPRWSSMLRQGGALALAWDSTRLSATQMHRLVSANSDLVALSDPPYDQLRHRVDRVIKKRDVVILRHS